MFQHGHNLKHNAAAVKSYLVRKTADKILRVMDWPLQGPTLNIIEAVRDHRDRERNKRQPKFEGRTLEKSERSWYNILEDYLRKLRNSLLKIDVLRAKGGHVSTDFCQKKPF